MNYIQSTKAVTVIQAEKQLGKLFAEAHWLESAVLPRIVSGPGLGIELEADVMGPKGHLRLIVKVKWRILRPVDIPIVAVHLHRRAQKMAEKGLMVLPLLVCPWISPRAAAECSKADLGWFDLAGNCHLSFPGVHIHREGIPNPFHSSKRKVAWSSPAAERLLRFLLEPAYAGRCWKQRELQTASGGQVSLGLVNKVARRLVEEAYAQAEPDGLRLNQPADLLREWARSRKGETTVLQNWYTLLHGPALEDALREVFALTEGNRRCLLGSFSAAKYLAPFARVATLHLYSDELSEEAIKSALTLEQTTEGENVVIEKPLNQDVFAGCLEVAPGLWSTSMVQTYLDLWTAGERGQEAAEHLLMQKLVPAWKGKA